MMGKKNNCLKLKKGVNPEMLLVHCVIQREILVSKNISPFLDKVLNSVIKHFSAIKANASFQAIL